MGLLMIAYAQKPPLNDQIMALAIGLEVKFF